jgi:hypothetical protein
MDNRINEIRRKIIVLRSGMQELEAAVRDQCNHGLDCADNALRQFAMRRELVILIDEWKSTGGGDRLPSLQARLKENQRSPDKATMPVRGRRHLK